MARKRERIFALILAAVFLVTSVGLTIFTIVEAHINSESTPPTTSNTPTKLQGTKLAGFTPIVSVPHLEEADLQEGTGPAATSNDTVTVNYTGAVASTGIIFQSSLDTGKTATFGLNQVIEGWKLGIPGMKTGGTRQLLIPAALAYGATPPAGSGIPPNADLVFDVTLVKID